MKNILCNLVRQLKWLLIGRKREIYTSKISDDLPWVYVSYISDVFYKSKKLICHQNQNETLQMKTIFNELGYNVVFQSYNSNRKIPIHNYKIIFGIEPNFERASKEFPNATKVYYATGAFYQHQNKMVERLTNQFNIYFKSNIPYRRTIDMHNSCSISDRILQIGSKNTILTYPVDFQSKVTLIHQSSLGANNSVTNFFSNEKEYVFIGSWGNALRGLGLLIEYFISHQNLILNVVGPIESDFFDAIKSNLTSNIHFYGFLDVNGDMFKSIVNRCNFMIYPSGSEGLPGSVLTCMKFGLIPIVSRWACLDDMSFGFIMNDCSINDIENGIRWSLSLNPDEIRNMRKDCLDYVQNHFSLSRFRNEFIDFFSKL